MWYLYFFLADQTSGGMAVGNDWVYKPGGSPKNNEK